MQEFILMFLHYVGIVFLESIFTITTNLDKQQQQQQQQTIDSLIESNNKTTTEQLLQPFSLDDQSPHDKTDQSKAMTRGINTII